MPNLTIDSQELLENNELALRSLALELAKSIVEPEELLQKFGINLNEYEKLSATHSFKKMLNAAILEWESAKNTKARIGLKSQKIIEEALPRLYQDMLDTDSPLSARTALFTQIAKIGGLGQEAAGEKTGETFSISINLGAGSQPLTIEGKVNKTSNPEDPEDPESLEEENENSFQLESDSRELVKFMELGDGPGATEEL